MPIDMAPAMSSATPPRTTMRDSPREERPAVRAKGTVRPSERPMITSLTTSGSINVLSSLSFSSLQHTFPSLPCLSHFAGSGIVRLELVRFAEELAA